MSRLNASFVLGYHGCDAEVGRKILSREETFDASVKKYNWLGDGIYFWGADPVRAWEWADEKVDRAEIKSPFVIGAVIDLRNCLDLMSREDIEFLKRAYDAFKENFEKNFPNETFPENREVERDGEKYALADLDCAVINYLCTAAKKNVTNGSSAKNDDGQRVRPISTSGSDKNSEESNLDYFDTVRGLFREGESILEGSMNMSKTHVQIAVRNPECLIEIFKKDRPESMS